MTTVDPATGDRDPKSEPLRTLRQYDYNICNFIEPQLKFLCTLLFS
uniref:Mediator of RNA polymerase II transcription subunit 7 n=1 Tax=Ascaris lumbricoides TaxID=6252 RepID=A0A0M3IQ16_ASCLU